MTWNNLNFFLCRMNERKKKNNAKRMRCFIWNNDNQVHFGDNDKASKFQVIDDYFPLQYITNMSIAKVDHQLNMGYDMHNLKNVLMNKSLEKQHLNASAL